MSAEVNAQDCYNQAEYAGLPSSLNFCTWSVDVSRGYYNWGCGDYVGHVCEAFANDRCIFTDLNYTALDCDGSILGDFGGKSYQYCCIGDNCNYEDIDITSCTQSTEYEEIVLNWYDCLYAEDSAYYRLLCDDEVEEITCNDLSDTFEQQGGCFCDFYAAFYDKVSDGTKDMLQDNIDTWMEQYSNYNEIYGCDIDLYCDLASGGDLISSQNDSVIPSTAPTFTSSDNDSGTDPVCFGIIEFVSLLAILYNIFV